MRFPPRRPAGAPCAPRSPRAPCAPRSPRAPCAPRSPRAPCAPRSPRAPCAPRSPRAPCAPGALLLLLLLAPRWPQAEAGPAGAVGTRELRCTCLRTSPRIHPQTIAGLQVTPAGPHCARVEVIASLKNGRTVCLDPEAPGVRRFLERTLGRANNQRR